MQKIIRVISVAVLCCLLWTTSAFAQSFGGSSYSSCGYGVNCPAESEGASTTTKSSAGNSTASSNTASSGNNTTGDDTVVQLPNGLQIAVNLYNGEHIPKVGYLILVTPLNGRGSSFASVQFVINGQTVHTSIPNEEGTASWEWYPNEPLNAHVTITVTVTGETGQTVSKTYTVIIGTSTNKNPVTKASATPTRSSALPVGIAHIFQRTPHVIIYAFPYFLFFLLAIGVAISAWGTWQEIKETRRLKSELAQLEHISASRRNFVNLVSHYLRTPVTLLRGGMELLPKDTIQANESLAETITALHAQVEDLIVSQDREQTADRQTTSVSLRTHTRPYFWLPASICIALVCLFDYLAQQADVLSTKSVTLYTQLIVCILVISSSYFALRYRQLSRRDRQLATNRLSLAHKSLEIREHFLHDATTSLTRLVTALNGSVTKLADSPGQKHMAEGLARIERAVRTFAIADSIRGARSSKPYEPLELEQLFIRVTGKLQKTITDKGIQVEQGTLASCQIQEPALFELVCLHVLDNAVTYAPAQSTISIKTTRTKQGITLQVTDHGPGIPKEEQQALFTPFEKAEESEVFTHEGMGFSLYLDLLIMLYLGDKISLDSHPSKTTVTLTINN